MESRSSCQSQHPHEWGFGDSCFAGGRRAQNSVLRRAMPPVRPSTPLEINWRCICCSCCERAATTKTQWYCNFPLVSGGHWITSKGSYYQFKCISIYYIILGVCFYSLLPLSWIKDSLDVVGVLGTSKIHGCAQSQVKFSNTSFGTHVKRSSYESWFIYVTWSCLAFNKILVQAHLIWYCQGYAAQYTGLDLLAKKLFSMFWHHSNSNHEGHDIHTKLISTTVSPKFLYGRLGIEAVLPIGALIYFPPQTKHWSRVKM